MQNMVGITNDLGLGIFGLDIWPYLKHVEVVYHEMSTINSSRHAGRHSTMIFSFTFLKSKSMYNLIELLFN